MHVYIRLETLARDLEGRLLLGAELARRGHAVYVGEITAELLARIGAPPGVFHDTNPLAVSSYLEVRTQLKSRGFLLTFQDEENALNEGVSALENYWRLRTSGEAIKQFDMAFAWGDLDSEVIRHLYPATHDHLYVLGSPRIDAWKIGSFQEPSHAVAPLVEEVSGGRFLVASNSVVWATPMSSFDYLRAVRSMEPEGLGLNLPANVVSNYERHVLRLASLVTVTDTLVQEFGTGQVVFRPHPGESTDFWREIFALHKGLEINNRPSLRAQLLESRALIHTNCTTALQARIGGRAVLSWVPEGSTPLGFDKLGRRVSSRKELSQGAAELAGGGHRPSVPVTRQEEAFLDELLVNWRSDAPSAAGHIAGAMEEMWNARGQSRTTIPQSTRSLHLRLLWNGHLRDPLLEALSQRLPSKRLSYRKMRIRMPTVADRAKYLARASSALSGVVVDAIGPRVVRLTPIP